jgi:hypothetical protein
VFRNVKDYGATGKFVFGELRKQRHILIRNLLFKAMVSQMIPLQSMLP